MKPPSFCVSMTSKRKPGPTISPVSPTWPPALAVERASCRARRRSAARGRPRRSGRPARRCAMMPTTLASALGRLVAEETRCRGSVFFSASSGLDWNSSIRWPPPDSMPCCSISLAKALPIEGQVVLGGQRLEQLGRKAVRRVHLGRLAAGDHLAALPSSCCSNSRSMRSRPASIVREEVALFLLDHLRHAGRRSRPARDRACASSRPPSARACAGTARARPSAGRRARPGAAAA